ncbi:hypothetical protein LIER_38977 [Lithospermum erythrorhizon]|uniref:MULE transposase domain-containing protein n=1 Tax=Lithospermum erythrorhizon TaxID=34254 RepID=A0AAV3QBY7_LITER
MTHLNISSITIRRFYIYLKPLVEGFHAGCKKVIGLDGCHTKGLYKQQILIAVGLDNNNDCWAIAWAVVEKENVDTWEWFLEGLIQDIGIVNQEEYVVISDKQKGLEQVINKLLPNVVKRNCVQYIYQNFKKEMKGGQLLRDRLWEPASKKKKQQIELKPPSTENEIEQ